MSTPQQTTPPSPADSSAADRFAIGPNRPKGARAIRWIVRTLIVVALAALAGFTATRMLPAERFADSVRRGLERSLSRPVDINGRARFVLLPRPGFSVEDVVIHEDPTFSVEPLAYVSNLEVGVSLRALLTGKLEVASIRLIEPSVNLMKLPEGGWNLQLFLEQTIERQRTLPSIEISTGRINFKIGDLKSVVYLAETDLTIEADADNPNRFGIRFEGEPARTDRAVRALGRLSGRGMLNWNPTRSGESMLQLSLSLDRASIGEIVTLVEGRSIGLGGFVSSRARLSGPLSKIAIEGRLQLDEFERWGWLLPTSTGRGLDYRGLVDFEDRRFQLETTQPGQTPLPLAVRMRVSDLLGRPRWAVHWTLRDLPLESLRALLTELTPAIAGDLPQSGAVSGALSITSRGLQGSLKTADSTLFLDGPVLTLQNANMEVRYDAATGARDIRYDLDAYPIAQLSQLTYLTPPPFLAALRHGTATGTVRYQLDAAGTPTYSGDIRLADTQFTLPGLADPVKLTSAAITLRPAGVAIRDMSGTVGTVAFTGSYNRGRIAIAARPTTVVELRRLLAPVLQRPTSLLSRFRRAETAPEWLRARRLDGTLEFASLAAGDHTVERLRVPFSWRGPRITVEGLQGAAYEGDLTGRVTVTADGPTPSFKGSFSLTGAAWHGAQIDLSGDARADGLDLDFANSLTIQGSFAARNLDLPDPAIKSVRGCFQYRPARIDLTALEAPAGTVLYQGQGTTTPDRRLSVDLAAPNNRTLRFTNLRLPFE